MRQKVQKFNINMLIDSKIVKRGMCKGHVENLYYAIVFTFE